MLWTTDVKHYIPITDKIVQQRHDQWVLFVHQELFFPMGSDVDLVGLLCDDAVCRPLSSMSEKGISCKIKSAEKSKKEDSHTARLCPILCYGMSLFYV